MPGPYRHRVLQLLQSIDARLTQIATQLATQGGIIMATLSDVEAAVSQNTTVGQSAVTLLNELKAKLDEAIASGDPSRIQAVVDAIGADTQALADAIVRNTPAATP